MHRSSEVQDKVEQGAIASTPAAVIWLASQMFWDFSWGVRIKLSIQKNCTYCLKIFLLFLHQSPLWNIERSVQ